MRTLVVMGVSGCGKSTLARHLAELLQKPFIEGDSYHPPGNIEKMRAGIPLNDDDRRPWLETLRDLIRAHRDQQGVVLACSALKQAYRDLLAEGDEQIAFIHLRGSKETLRARLEARRDHFMPASLLDSQLATLEEPANAWTYDVSQPVAEVARDILDRLSPLRPINPS